MGHCFRLCIDCNNLYYIHVYNKMGYILSDRSLSYNLFIVRKLRNCTPLNIGPVPEKSLFNVSMNYMYWFVEFMKLSVF